MQLKADNVVPFHGLDHRDRPPDAAKWLDDLGDPYTRTGVYLNGRVSIDWGVYGVPETFVIGRDGRIAYKHVGAITPAVLQAKILPLIESLCHADTVSSELDACQQPRSAGERRSCTVSDGPPLVLPLPRPSSHRDRKAGAKEERR